MIDIIYKTVKPSHLEKLRIIQNINNLMFQVIFMYILHTFKVTIFGLSTAHVEIHQIPHVIFQKVSFSSKFGSLFNVMRDNSSVLF